MADLAEYGLIAAFTTPETLVEAVKSCRKRGYRAIDAFSPFPVEELAPALGFEERSVAKWALLGGITGGLTGWGMQHYSAVWGYPLNVGGRPLLSWPSFVPVTFEMTVLASAFAAVASVLILSGLPRPHHPLFSSSIFERVTRDRFLLLVSAKDPLFDSLETRRFIESLSPEQVEEVPG